MKMLALSLALGAAVSVSACGPRSSRTLLSAAHSGAARTP